MKIIWSTQLTSLISAVAEQCLADDIVFRNKQGQVKIERVNHDHFMTIVANSLASLNMTEDNIPECVTVKGRNANQPCSAKQAMYYVIWNTDVIVYIRKQVKSLVTVRNITLRTQLTDEQTKQMVKDELISKFVLSLSETQKRQFDDIMHIDDINHIK